MESPEPWVSAARAALPGRAGKAFGAGLGAAFNSGHTVRVIWADGKQSIIGFPEKQFMVLSILLRHLQVATEMVAKPEEDVPPGVAEKIAGFASSVLPKRGQKPATAEDAAPVPDATEQIAKLASLHAQGILTDTEFSEKKAELLKRL